MLPCMTRRPATGAEHSNLAMPGVLESLEESKDTDKLQQKLGGTLALCLALQEIARSCCMKALAMQADAGAPGMVAGLEKAC